MEGWLSLGGEGPRRFIGARATRPGKPVRERESGLSTAHVGDGAVRVHGGSLWV